MLVNCLHFRCTSIHPLLLVGIHVAQVFNILYGVFTWRSLFVLWFFFFWSLHCLSLCDLRPLITPLGILKLFWDFHYLFYALPPYLQKKANHLVSCWLWLSYWTEVMLTVAIILNRSNRLFLLHNNLLTTTIVHNINIPRWNLSNPWPKKNRRRWKYVVLTFHGLRLYTLVNICQM